MNNASRHVPVDPTAACILSLLRTAAAIGILVIGVLSLVPGYYRPTFDWIPDQLEHALAYLPVALVTTLCLPRIRQSIIIFGFAAAACGLEICQLFVVERSSSINDAASSIIGTIIGVTVAAQIMRQVSRYVAAQLGEPSRPLQISEDARPALVNQQLASTSLKNEA